MCGICGYISKKDYNEKILKEMNDTLKHRGPDDEGFFRCKLDHEWYIGLGHRRLSILDLSMAGHQPMLSEDERYGIVYNGEVYNFMELRQELEEKGYCFVSNCDTEVILSLFIEYGQECLKKLNGMFALALIDFRKQEMILARDRMGKKPLYYYYLEDENVFVFASELKAIMKFPGFKKEIRTELLSAYLVNKSFPSPQTVFKNTYKVEPGQSIVWKNGRIQKNMYWNLLERFKECSKKKVESYELAKRELKELLMNSVEKRLVADVPVGIFLSGGIDSTLIAALTKKVSEKKVRTYTIGFYTKNENEAVDAKKVADYLGTKHRELYVSEKELFEQIKNFIYYYDEPFSDSSQIPMMLVSKLAREEVTVALSGDGGDELFCGYEMYDWIELARKWDIFGNLGYALCNLPVINKIQLMSKMPDKLYAFFNNRDERRKIQLFQDVRQRYTKDMIVGDSVSAKYAFEDKIFEIDSIYDNWQMKRMLLDMRYYLADEVLVKTDRASMKYSLEIRCPLLDFRVVEYSFAIPHEFKYYKKNKKWILKDLVYEMVPKELLERPKKGFGVPLTKWLREELNDKLLRYADKDILKKQGIFQPEKINEFIQKLMLSNLSVYSSVLWGFFVFQVWYQEYIEDLWS